MPTLSRQRFRRWRRYLHITVRGLIALIGVMALGLAWEAHRTRIQRRAAAAIRAADGSVKYNWQWRNGETVPDAKPPAPEQIVEFVGVDHFGRVKAVPKLTGLYLGYTRVTDAGLVNLAGLGSLSNLDLSGTEVSDLGLAHLKGLPGLTSLKLGKTNVTDAGLAHLRSLTNLVYLEVCETRVTLSGADELEQSLPKLTIRRSYF